MLSAVSQHEKGQKVLWRSLALFIPTKNSKQHRAKHLGSGCGLGLRLGLWLWPQASHDIQKHLNISKHLYRHRLTAGS